MTTRYGRASGGQQCVDHTPWGHWSVITLLTAIRGGKLMERAALTKPGAMTGALFVGYVGFMLARCRGPATWW